MKNGNQCKTFPLEPNGGGWGAMIVPRLRLTGNLVRCWPRWNSAWEGFAIVIIVGFLCELVAVCANLLDKNDHILDQVVLVSVIIFTSKSRIRTLCLRAVILLLL